MYVTFASLNAQPESKAAAAIKDILFNLHVAKPPKDVTIKQLFQVIQTKLKPAISKAGKVNFAN